MSDLVRCDGCLSTLVVNKRGVDPAEERAAWIQITAFSETFDACTTTCAVDILNDDNFQSVLAGYTTAAMGGAHAIKEYLETNDE